MTQSTALTIVSQDRELQVATQRFGALITGDKAAEERIKLVALVNAGFDPRLGHLAPYEGRVIITLDGAAFWKNRQDPQRRFGIITRPVKTEDRACYGLAEDEIGVVAEVRDYQNNGVVIAEGFGKASTRPYTYERNVSPRSHPDRKRNPIDATHPFAMAQKRAEGQAIKRAFPTGVDADILPREDLGHTTITVEAEPSSQPSVPPGPRSWPNIGAFLTDAAKPPEEGFGWERAKVLAVLGVKAATDIADLADAWNTLTLAHIREVSAELDKAAANQQ